MALFCFVYNNDSVFDSFQTFNILLVGYLYSFLPLLDWRAAADLNLRICWTSYAPLLSHTSLCM